MPAAVGRLGLYQVNAWMTALAATALFATVFTSDPNAASDPLSVEVLGSGYNRVQASFSRTGPGLITLDTVLVIPAIPPGATGVWVGFMDAAANGHLIASDLIRDPLTGIATPRSYPAGGTFVIPAGEYTIGIDAQVA